MSPIRAHIFDLPPELLNEILLKLAKMDYSSIYGLARTCHYLEDRCNEFIEKNPPQKFLPPVRVAGMSDSDDYDDYYDDDNNDIIDDHDDIRGDLDRFVDDAFDRFSYGSNYDEELDEYLNKHNEEG